MIDTGEQADIRTSRVPVALVYAIFFVSGVASLIYEVSWSRLVGIALGNTADSAAVVLAAYFTGLAIGQWIGGLLASRLSPLLGYGLAELAAAAWGAAVPALLTIGRIPSIASTFSNGHILWCFFILLPATIPLGMTWPLIFSVVTRGQGSRKRSLTAYAINTIGGLVGVLVASIYLLAVVGVSGSGLLAAVLTASCGMVACTIAIFSYSRTTAASPFRIEPEQTSGSWLWLIVVAISGFGVLGLEVLYNRMFSLIFHNSAYTFGLVVSAFLLALALGATVASHFASRFSPWSIAAASLILGGAVLAVSVSTFPRVTSLEYFSIDGSFERYLLGASALVALFIVPPIALLGMALPAALQTATSPAFVGRLTSVNTLAAVAGTVLAGFQLPQAFGLWPSFALFVAAFLLVGIVLLVLKRQIALASTTAIVLAGTVVIILCIPISYDEPSDLQLVRRWETAYGWVDVVRDRGDGALAVRQNLHYQHGSTADAIREYRQGRLPLLLHPKPNDVAFLGLGTGLTAAPVVIDRDVKSTQIVELIPEIVEACELLTDANLSVVNNRKVEVCVDDARHFLNRSDRQFDVVVSDLFVPWESRSGYLYTVEFYQTVKHRLKPRGLFCQWIALYQVAPEDFEMIADSYASVFRNVTVWWGRLDPRSPIVALVGCDGPLVIDASRWESQSSLPGGIDPELAGSADLPLLFLGTWHRDAGQLNTDEHPLLEFAAPISHLSGRTMNGEALKRYFDGVLVKLPPEGVSFLRESQELIDDWRRRQSLQRLILFGEDGP